MKVSAIVPVYNPGADIDDCIDTLVNQSLSPGAYEVIFVDDGSTDDTPARLDRLAEEHAHVRVAHIPNSGWPGRPRNVGIELARGEYVYFVDNDDYVERDALEQLFERAVAEDADVVIGKVIGHGKVVPRALFGQNRAGATLLATPSLLAQLTPHRLFRRSMLDEHGIRFPEGRRRLEDHVFTTHAYFHARRISVLADRPIYHWMARGPGANASFGRFDPVGYFDNLREVLDIVEEHTEPGPLRDQLMTHWYRTKMLGRVGGPFFLRCDPEYRRAVYDAVSGLAHERFGPQMDPWLGHARRLRSHLLLEGSFESLEQLAETEARLKAKVRLTDARRKRNGAFVLRFEARVIDGGGLGLGFQRRGDRIFRVARDLPDAVPERLLDVTDEVLRASAHVLLRGPSDRSEWVLPTTTRVRLVESGGVLTPVLTGEARIVPGSAGGSLVPAGRWNVAAVVNVVGLQAVGRIHAGEAGAGYTITLDGDGAVPADGRATVLKQRVARRLRRATRALRYLNGAIGHAQRPCSRRSPDISRTRWGATGSMRSS